MRYTMEEERDDILIVTSQTWCHKELKPNRQYEQ